MTGLRKYPPTLGEQWFSDLVDFLGGPTAAAQITTLKILLEGAGGALLNSWQGAGDLTKIDAGKIYGVIPVGNLGPLTGDLDFNGHKALNILLQVLASDPGSPAAGQVWYRSDLDKLSIRRASVTDRVVLEDLAQTLTNKTLTTPTIGSFVNAVHNHQANAGGGGLDVAAITTGQFSLTRMPRAASGFLHGKGANLDPAYETIIATDIPSLDVAKVTTGAFVVARGGTGLATIAAGGILYASALDTFSRIAPSAANQVLRSTAANALEIAALVAADIPSLDAAKITTGRFPLARLPDAATNKFIRSQGVGSDSIYDTLVAADIPNLDAAKITTGRFIAARLLDGTSGYFLKAQGAGIDPIYALLVAADIPNLDAAKLTTGLLAIARGGLNNATWTALQLVRMNAGGTAFESSGKTIADFAATTHTHVKVDVTDFAHKASHISGGGDAFAAGDLLDATSRIKVRKNTGADVGARRRLNLIEGANISLTVADDAADEEVDVTITGPAAGAGTPHNVLDGVTHPDTLVGTVVRGDVIVGNATPKWARKGLGGVGTFLRSDGTDLLYAALLAADIPNLDAAKITTGTIPLTRLPKPDSCQVRRTTNQSIANAAWTFVTLPDSEDWDYANMHDLVTNSQRIMIATAGKYLFGATLYYIGNATGQRYCALEKNAAVPTGGTLIAINSPLATPVTYDTIQVMGMMDMAAGDYATAATYQNSTAALNLAGAIFFATYMSV